MTALPLTISTLISIINFVNPSLLPLRDSRDDLKIIMECILHGFRYENDTKNLFIVSNDIEIHNFFNGLMIYNPELPFKTLKTVTIDYYLINHNKLNTDIFDKLKQYKTFNSRGKCIVYITLNAKSLKITTEFLWKIDIFNVIFVKPSNETCEIYTWYPYSKGCCGNNQKIVPLKNVNRAWFDEKIPKKFNPTCCTVDMLMPIEIGRLLKNFADGKMIYDDRYDIDQGLELLEENFIATIAQYLNLGIQIHFVNMTDDDMLDSLTYNGAITVGPYPHNQGRYEKYDSSKIYHHEELHWCVPEIIRPKYLNNFTDIVTLEVLSSIPIMHFILTISYFCVTDYNFGHVSLKTFSILLGLSTRQPTLSKQRYFFLLLTMYSFWIIIVFQTALSSNLAMNKHEQTYKTVDDILDSNLQVFCYEQMDDVLIATRNVEMFKRREIYWDLSASYHDLPRKDMVFCTSYIAYTQMMLRAMKEYQDPLLYCFNEAIWTEAFNRFDEIIEVPPEITASSVSNVDRGSMSRFRQFTHRNCGISLE